MPHPWPLRPRFPLLSCPCSGRLPRRALLFLECSVMPAPVTPPSRCYIVGTVRVPQVPLLYLGSWVPLRFCSGGLTPPSFLAWVWTLRVQRRGPPPQILAAMSLNF